MLINNQNYLHGRLVGIGKIRKDGSSEFQFLEKPINNMILRCGLNEFMTYNGSNSASVSPSSTNMNPWNVIRFCGFGTGGDANDFALTNNLQSIVGNPYNTRFEREWPFNGIGTMSVTDNFYKIRVTHISPAATESISVREIGYYKNYSSINHLFSRIVLPSVYQLDVGDKLITTYELVVSFDSTITNIENSGLHDSNDDELDYQSAQRIIDDPTRIRGWYPTSTDFTQTTSYHLRPFAFSPFTYWDMGPYSGGDNDKLNRFSLKYTKSSFNFPNGSFPNFLARFRLDSDRPTCSINNYITDSFKRDVVVNVPAYWPEMTTPTDYRDIYAILFGTLYIRFGHFDANMDFTPAPWRKLASRTAKFVFRQSIATVDSLSWTPPSE